MKAQSSEAKARVRAFCCWQDPPASLVLDPDDVHVWRIPLAVPPGVVADTYPLLSDEESARAKRILCDEAGRRFVVSHGVMRRILSRYLDERPDQIRLATEGRGKPHLASHADPPALCFNLSHSGEYALCAVARGRDIGVDIERIRPVSAWRDIAARYFSERERHALHSLSGHRATEAFFQIWTFKEAYTKALGEGVSRRWTQFSLSVPDVVALELPGAESVARAQDRFTVCALDPGSGYAAAVAAQGVGWHLSCWQWIHQRVESDIARLRQP